MKQAIALFLIFASINTAVNAQKLSADRVPAAVKAAFVKAYPNTTVKWEKEGDLFEAGFKQNNQTTSVLYDASGTMHEIEVDIKTADLPKAAVTYVTKTYPGKKIKESARITKADGSVNFEAEVNGQDLIFDTAGNFIKAVKE